MTSLFEICRWVFSRLLLKLADFRLFYSSYGLFTCNQIDCYYWPRDMKVFIISLTKSFLSKESHIPLYTFKQIFWQSSYRFHFWWNLFWECLLALRTSKRRSFIRCELKIWKYKHRGRFLPCLIEITKGIVLFLHHGRGCEICWS